MEQVNPIEPELVSDGSGVSRFTELEIEAETSNGEAPTGLICGVPVQKLRPIRGTHNPMGVELDCDSLSYSLVKKIKSEMDANFKSQFSSFSFSSLDLATLNSTPHSTEGPKINNNKKRKNVEFYLENLMNKVMVKQEQMHQQLMEMIEFKEKERLIREDSWRQHQMDRSNKDQEFRSHQVARALNLLSIIRKALGQDNNNNNN